MANPEHVKILKQGVDIWNKWRKDNPDVIPDLQDADLSGVNLKGENFQSANLKGAILEDSDLSLTDFQARNLNGWHIVGVEFIKADFENAQLRGANLERTAFESANLRNVDFTGANLEGVNFYAANLANTKFDFTCLRAVSFWSANLCGASFYNANFVGVGLYKTVFADVNLSGVENLDKCHHSGPSWIDFRTLQKSGPLPRRFLQGVGLPEVFIDYLPSLFDSNPFHFYSCFISYYHEDQEFAERLHTDLLDKGVRVWLDKHDMPIGGRIRKVIDQEIRVRDKVILVLSENTVQSNWVEYEVDKTLDEEIRRKTDILMPVRLDDSVFDCEDNWAKRLSENRSIGDFTRWKEHDEYKKTFDFLMKWLKSEKEGK